MIDECRARIEAEAQAVADAGSDRDHVLDRTRGWVRLRMAPTMNGNPNVTELIFEWEFERFAGYVAVARRAIRSSEQGCGHLLSHFDISCANVSRT